MELGNSLETQIRNTKAYLLKADGHGDSNLWVPLMFLFFELYLFICIQNLWSLVIIFVFLLQGMSIWLPCLHRCFKERLMMLLVRQDQKLRAYFNWFLWLLSISHSYSKSSVFLSPQCLPKIYYLLSCQLQFQVFFPIFRRRGKSESGRKESPISTI